MQCTVHSTTVHSTTMGVILKVISVLRNVLAIRSTKGLDLDKSVKLFHIASSILEPFRCLSS